MWERAKWILVLVFAGVLSMAAILVATFPLGGAPAAYLLVIPFALVETYAVLQLSLVRFRSERANARDRLQGSFDPPPQPQVIREFKHPRESRRVQILLFPDGTYGFEEAYWLDDQKVWVPSRVDSVGIYADEEIALREAYGRVDWLSSIPP